MAEGTKIDELFISLGLDLSQLDKDFVTADNTVRQGITKLSQKQTQTKLRMEIDMSRFAGAENSTQALAVKTQYLNQQLELQKQKIALVNAAYLQSVQAKGADSAASQRLLTNLLREQNAEASLAAQIRQANAARASGGLLSNITGGATSAINGATAGFAALQNRLIGIMAIAATGAGLFNVVKGAVDSGDALYQLSNKLHVSTAEASELNRVLKMGDVDSKAFISMMIRLDKAVETAGKNGNTTTNALKEFGISLTDAAGELLPMNQQLDQLAKGYDNAAKAGREEAYVSELLGARGQALLPVLQQYNDLKEASSRVTTTGLIDPKAAHQLSIDFKVLSMEATQLGNAFGAALMPIAKEVAPMVIDGMKSIIQSIKDNKESIVDVSRAIGSLISEANRFEQNTFGKALDALGQKGVTFTNLLFTIEAKMRALTNHPFLSMIPGYLDNKGVPEAEAQLKAERKRQQDIKDLQNNNADWVNRQNSKGVASQAATVSKTAGDAEKQIALDVYKATHTACENQIKDIETKAAAYRTAGASEAEIANFVAAETAKVNADHAKEEQQKTSDRQKMISDVYGTALQKRLAQIEEEKNKYIQAGIDEAQAREMVEKQKLDAIKDYSEKAGNAMRSALMGGWGDVVNAVSQAIQKGQDVQTALNAAMEKNKTKLNADNRAMGLVASRVWMAPDEIGAMKNNPYTALQSATKDYRAANPENNFGVEIIRGTMSSVLEENNRKLAGAGGQTASRQGNIITVSPTININNPKVDSEQDIAKLADKVADIIQPAVVNAIGGNSNGY